MARAYPQVISKALWKEGSQRIGVENSNPENCPGQAYYQDQSNNAKYLYDCKMDRFIESLKKLSIYFGILHPIIPYKGLEFRNEIQQKKWKIYSENIK